MPFDSEEEWREFLSETYSPLYYIYIERGPTPGYCKVNVPKNGTCDVYGVHTPRVSGR